VIPVEQRLLFDAETGQRGDCLKCCFASLLELEYDDVPHFAAMGDMWWIEQTNWLRDRGWLLANAYWTTAPGSDGQRLTGYTEGYWLAGVRSLRTRPDGSNLGHTVVMLDGDLVWDPHPARADGHLGFTDGHVLRPYDPARFVLKAAA
jgi:hypothetical protein